MFKPLPRQYSLRNRLIAGVGLMLLPLVAIAGGSYISFEQAIDAFEKSENQRLEEVFPLDRLEDSLIKTSSLLKTANNTVENTQTQAQFKQLSLEIDQTFNLILNSPSQLAEKQSLVIEIQREWQQIQVQGQQIVMFSPAFKSARVQKQLLRLNQQLDQTINEVRRLNNRLTNFQTDDNLKRAKNLKQRVRSITISTATIAVLMAVGSGFFLARSILKPLKLLDRGVARLGEGELSFRIHLNSRDELEQLANTMNWMAENLEQSQRILVEMATVDGLTGVFNRREFNRRLTIELERSRREGHPVSLLMVDIDHFKKLNDTYGHQSGDDALRHVSKLIKTEVRPGDLPARYGGEEFAIILPYANETEAWAVAERLRELIAAQAIPVQEGQQVAVTASLGCATFPADAHHEESLMAQADAALYQAKRNGRNRVWMAAQRPSVTHEVELGAKVL